MSLTDPVRYKYTMLSLFHHLLWAGFQHYHRYMWLFLSGHFSYNRLSLFWPIFQTYHRYNFWGLSLLSDSWNTVLLWSPAAIRFHHKYKIMTGVHLWWSDRIPYWDFHPHYKYTGSDVLWYHLPLAGHSDWSLQMLWAFLFDHKYILYNDIR